MPGQGLFIGEPLARPYAGVRHRAEGDGLTIAARLLPPGVYDVQASASMIGPYRSVGRLQVPPGARELRLGRVPPAYYRFVRSAEAPPSP